MLYPFVEANAPVPLTLKFVQEKFCENSFSPIYTAVDRPYGVDAIKQGALYGI